jgi:hypothetical protein
LGRTYPYCATWKEKRASKFSTEENLIWCCDQNLCPCFQILLVDLQKPSHITSNVCHSSLLVPGTSLLLVLEA